MKNYYNDFVKTSQDIIRIPSVQGDPVCGKPFGEDVANCLDYVLDLAEKMGFRVHNNGYYYGYAEIGEGELFGILGHLDTVPFGDGWSVSPTSGDIIDGVMYGRGVLDDKVPILSTLFAVKELVDNGYLPNKRIRIIFGCNEESGWECIKKYVKEDEMPVSGFSPDSDFPVIFAEKGVVNYEISVPLASPLISIKGGERPNMVMDGVDATILSSPEAIAYLESNAVPYITNGDTIDLHFDGVSAHGSTPDKGENALFPLLDLLSKIGGDTWSTLRYLLSDITGKSLGIDISDEVSGALTMNVGMIYIRDNNLVFTFDIRYPISYKQQYIYDILMQNIPNAHIEIIGSHDPLYVDKDSELVRTLLDAYNEYAHDDAEPIAIGGATYARALKNAVAFGPVFPGRESTIHQKDERVSMKDMENMYNIYKLAIKKLCFND